MYRITVQTLTGSEHTIYVPGNEEYIVTSAVLSLSVGSVGEFTFTVPLGNPRYDEIVDHSIITVYEDHAEIWRGDIQDIKTNFDKSLSVYCLEDMAWLGESAVAMTAITDQTYGQRFSAAINAYNANQVAKRQFTAGQLTSITTTNICTWTPQYEEDLLSCLRNYIADDGYVRIRRAYTGTVLTRYVDIVKLSDYGQQADQTIEFGSNLLDFVKEMDNTNFLNVIYPYGKETETPLYGEIMQRIVGTPQENAVSIAAFGRRERSVIFETDSLARLNSLAQSYLNRYSQPIVKLEIKAIDLGNIEIVNKIRLGDSVHIIAAPFGIDQWSYATKQELNLLDIADNQITLADAVRAHSLTSQVIEQAQEIEKAQTPLSILDEAKRNAWAIFEGDNGGIVTFQVNNSEQIIGIIIANNLDINQATKAWGWNVNGLCYVHREYPTDEWQLGIAMTMNGEIVADYITTGTLTADIIKTGTLNAALANVININANNINAGYLSASRIRGDVLVLGGDNNVSGQEAVFSGFRGEESGQCSPAIPSQSYRFWGTTYPRGGLFIDVTYASDTDVNGNVGKYTGALYNEVYLKPGLNFIEIYNANAYFEYTISSLLINGEYSTFNFTVYSADLYVTLSNTGLYAINSELTYAEISDAEIDNYTFENGEISRTDNYVLVSNTIQNTGSNRTVTLLTFTSSDYYFHDSSNNLKLGYKIPSGSTASGGNVEVQRRSSGSSSWTTIDTISLATSSGSYTYSLVTFGNNDGYDYRIRMTIYGSTTVVSRDYSIFIANTTAVSISADGYYGKHYGQFFGRAENLTHLTANGGIQLNNTDFYTQYLQNVSSSNKYKLSYDGLSTANSYGSVELNVDSVDASIDIYKDTYNKISINTDDPEIDVYKSQYKYIRATNTRLMLYSSSSTYAIFRGYDDLITYQSGTAYTIPWTSSDGRYKEEIEDLDVDLSVKLIDATVPKKFKYKNKQGKHYGMIAQEARDVLDNHGETDARLEYCSDEENEFNPRNINYQEYVPLLINYVKDLRAEIEALKIIINTLKED